MKLLLLSVGKPKANAMAEATHDYVERLRRYTPVESVVVAAEDIAPRASASTVTLSLARESDRLQAKIPAGAFTVALDRGGRALDSQEMAATIGRWQHSERVVAFAIGSAHGLAPEFVARARAQWSLSKLTLPHELALLLLAEQLYRAHTILRGEPYHK